jgi:hypothetical protein
MYTPAARRGTALLVLILLLISVLLEQAIAAICPPLGELGGVRPMIVFLDIPLEAPLTIDWVPVGFIFMLFYTLVGWPRTTDNHRSEIQGRGWAVLGRWWLLLIFLLAGGLLYYELSGFLPKTIRNGIDSFGMRADLVLPYPSGQTVHLQGGMVLLVFFWLGWRLLIKKAVPPAAAVKRAVQRSIGKADAMPPMPDPVLSIPRPVIATPPILAEADLSSRGRIAMRIPEPVEVKTTGGRACVYVSVPEGYHRKRISYPCVVDGGVRPAGSRTAS